MKKAMALILVLGLMCLLAASGLAANTPSNTIPPTSPPSTTEETPSTSNTTKSDVSAVPTRIKITAGNTVMYATMKNNRTAKEFV